MNSEPDDEPDVDGLILDGDEARPGWKRRAVGTTREAALAQIPRVGMLQCQVPIDPLRDIQRHIAARGENQARWLRRAVVEVYLRQGGDPEVAAAALAMRRDQRRREVSRDQLGQARNRTGRKPRPRWVPHDDAAAPTDS